MRLPFNGRNKVTSVYGSRTLNGVEEFHKGLDIVGLDDTTVRAMCSGRVRVSTIVYNKSNKTWQWGNYVCIVDDKTGNYVYTCHLSKRLVKANTYVKEGDPIGIMGNTGYSFGAHTHVEIRQSPYRTNNPVNPLLYLKNIKNEKGVYDSEEGGIYMTNEPIVYTGAKDSNKINCAQYKIIDVSRYQGSIDWKKVAASGIKGAIIRAGYGRYISQKDPLFETNYKGAKEAGLLVGAYWYSYATSIAQVQQEAVVCNTAISGKQFELPIYYDQEDKCMADLSMSARTSLATTWLATMARFGWFVGYYCYTSWAKTVDYNSIANMYTTWLADYRASYDKTLPRDMHQYTSSGTVNGISGRVDMNNCTRDFATEIKATNTNGWSGKAVDSNEKLPDQQAKPTMEKCDGKLLEIKTANCEYFDTYSVDKPAGKFAAGSVYTISAVEKSGELVNGFRWATVTKDGKEVWVALVEDGRCVIVDKVVANPNPTISYALINSGNYFIRKTPSSSGAKTGKFAGGGQYYKVLKESNGWVGIDYLNNGTVGWVGPTAIKKKYSHKAGEKIVYTGVVTFASASNSGKYYANKTYYLYDAELINGKYRVTDAANKVGRKPIGSNVVGWCKISGIK